MHVKLRLILYQNRTADYSMMNDNNNKTQRDNAVSTLNALQRLVVIVGQIDHAFAQDLIGNKDYDRLVYVRNALCACANIWNENLSDNMNKLYDGMSPTMVALSADQATFYGERMPKSIAFAAQELEALNVPNTTHFKVISQEIKTVLSLYALHSADIAQYLKMHQENIDDIPMMKMMDVSSKTLSKSASIDVNLAADKDSELLNRHLA